MIFNVPDISFDRTHRYAPCVVISTELDVQPDGTFALGKFLPDAEDIHTIVKLLKVRPNGKCLEGILPNCRYIILDNCKMSNNNVSAKIPVDSSNIITTSFPVIIFKQSPRDGSILSFSSRELKLLINILN